MVGLCANRWVCHWVCRVQANNLIRSSTIRTLDLVFIIINIIMIVIISMYILYILHNITIYIIEPADVYYLLIWLQQRQKVWFPTVKRRSRLIRAVAVEARQVLANHGK